MDIETKSELSRSTLNMFFYKPLGEEGKADLVFLTGYSNIKFKSSFFNKTDNISGGHIDNGYSLNYGLGLQLNPHQKISIRIMYSGGAIKDMEAFSSFKTISNVSLIYRF